MIPGNARTKFTGRPEVDYNGKDVCVTGVVVDYRGKPEIVVNSPKQLKVVLTDNTVKIPANN
jgi:micrococcal nuclease